MKQYFTKISSVLLAFMLLFSTLSFAVDKHFCGDFLVDISFVGNADSCASEISENATIHQKECCKNEVENIEGQDELQYQNLEKITFEKQQFLLTFVFSSIAVFSDTTQNAPFQKDVSAPEKQFDFQVKYQTFII